MSASVKITIFQAPHAYMLDKVGRFRWLQRQDQCKPNIPAEYYLPVFTGEIDLPDGIPNCNDAREKAILEHVFEVFNTGHPAGYCARNLAAGDVIKLEGRTYVCHPVGFQECEFRMGSTPGESGISPEQIQKAEQVLIDNGIEADEAQTVLQAIGYVLLDTALYPEN